MNKQKTISIAVFATIALLVITTGAVFAAGLTQGGPSWFAENEADDYSEYWGPMHGRGGRWSSGAPLPPMHEAMVQAVADATGLSVNEIEERIIGGERLFRIALDAGVDEADYFDLVAEVRETFLSEALAEGWITEEHYQWMQERFDSDEFRPGYGGCHRYEAEGFFPQDRSPGRGRRGRW